MESTIKNKISKLAVLASIVLADYHGAKVTKIKKGEYDINGVYAGDLASVVKALDEREKSIAAPAASTPPAPQDADAPTQEATAEDAPAGPQGAATGPQDAPADDSPAGDPPAYPTAYPTDTLAHLPQTEQAILTNKDLRTLTANILAAALPYLAEWPLPALVRLGAGGDAKARYYPGDIIGYEPEGDGIVTIRLTGADKAEGRPFQLLRIQRPDGSMDVQVKHKISRRTIAIATAAFLSLEAQKPKRIAAPRVVKAGADIATLEAALEKANADVVKAQGRLDSILSAISLAKQTATAPAETTPEMRAEAEAAGVTFSNPGDQTPSANEAFQASVAATAAMTETDDKPQPPTPSAPPPQTAPVKEFAGNDTPPPAEYEIEEALRQEAEEAQTVILTMEIEREPVEDDVIEDDQYPSLSHVESDELEIAA